MDVEILSKLIRDLAADNDTVGLPGLGSFAVAMAPAAFSDRGYTINPPYRKLSFSSTPSDDGLLVSRYAALCGLSQSEAEESLRAFLSDLCETLKRRKVVSLPSLGRLRATQENNFFFVADETLDIYPEGFGLGAVSLKTHGLPEEFAGAAAELPSVAEPVTSVSERQNFAGAGVELPAVGETEPQETEIRPEETAEAEAEDHPKGNTTEEEELTPAGSGLEKIDSEQVVEETENGAKEEIAATDSNIEQSDTEPVTESTPIEEETQSQESKAKPEEAGEPLSNSISRHHRWWIAPVAVVALALLLLAAFVVLSRIAPDFIDTLLYTPEELKIINS